MNIRGQKANRLDLSERLLIGWEEIYHRASPPLMALRLVEAEIELLRTMREHDADAVDELLDRYERVADRLRGVGMPKEPVIRLEISERALRRWEQMSTDGSFRRFNARLMEREAATLRTLRDNDPPRVDALIRRYLVLAANLRLPRRVPAVDPKPAQ